MTDAYDSLRADLESARATTESALGKARAAEQAAWSVYKNSGYLLEHRQTWHAAHEAAGQVGAALGQLDRACKAAATNAAVAAS